MRSPRLLGPFIAIGAGAGVAIGVGTHHLALGLIFGVVFGIALGAIADSKKR